MIIGMRRGFVGERLAPEVVVAEHVAVVRDEEYQRAVELSQGSQRVHHPADLFVHEADGAVVSLAAVANHFFERFPMRESGFRNGEAAVRLLRPLADCRLGKIGVLVQIETVWRRIYGECGRWNDIFRKKGRSSR